MSEPPPRQERVEPAPQVPSEDQSEELLPRLPVTEADLHQVSSSKAVSNAEVGRPSTLTAESIDVESVLQPLGLEEDGSLEVPAAGPLYDRAGWFTGSPRPGEIGPAVLLGHVNGTDGSPSVFSRLAELRGGDRVTVSREDGTRSHFEVYLVEQYPKDSFPTAAVYGDTTRSELRLITCAGSSDPWTGRHKDNTVVYAKLVSG